LPPRRTIALAAVRLYYISVQLKSADPSFDGVLATVLTQVELAYSLIASTIPCLRPFMAALNTELGAMNPRSVLNSRAYELSKDSNGSYAMAAMRNGKPNGDTVKSERPVYAGEEEVEGAHGTAAGKRESVELTPGQHIFRGDHARSTAKVTASEKQVDADSIGTNDSQRMIIKKDVQWVIETGSTGGGSTSQYERQSPPNPQPTQYHAYS
jgi:hypothetical protein